MNKKGSLGSLMVMFIGAIFVLAIIPSIAEEQASLTSSRQNINETVTILNTTVDTTGSIFLGSAVVTNATGGEIVPADNYTLNDGLTTGDLTVRIVSLGGSYTELDVNVSYEYGPEGYVTSAGTRSIAALITLFAALGLVAFVIGKGISELNLN